MEVRKSGMPCFFVSIPIIKYTIILNDMDGETVAYTK